MSSVPTIDNLGLVLGDHAQSGDEAIVFVAPDGAETRWRYRDIDDASRRVANHLRGLALEPGARIGIVAANSVEYLYAYLGIMRGGFVAVPANQRAAAETIAFIADDANVRMVFTDEASKGLIPHGLPVMALESLADRLQPAGDYRDPDADPESTAQILYTSGSTGTPKGVVLSHRSQLAMVAHVNEDESGLFRGTGIVVAPMFHMNALVFLQTYLTAGGRVVLMERFSAPLFARAIERHGVNMITGVPTMIALLHAAWQDLDQPDLTSVGTVYIGSAPVTEAIVQQALEMMPGATVLNSYGTTETGGGLFGMHPDGIPRPPTAVGYPNAGIGIRLVDSEGRESKNEGVLLVKARSAMTEYLNLPELTAGKIRDGWIDTGDIFQRDENGFFYFVGRNDDMFVCSGENIFPGEVERILESHPAVDQASVVPVPDAVRGQMPVAWIVAGGETSQAELQDYVRSKAPPYLYPRRVWFIDELPLAGTSKIDRNRLKADAAERMENEHAC